MRSTGPDAGSARGGVPHGRGIRYTAPVDFSTFADLDLVLICGLPGSGKSHFSERFFKDQGRKRVSRKEIRRLLYEMTNFGAAWSETRYAEVDEHLVKHVERKIIEQLLQNKQKVLVDNTCVTAAAREVYVAVATQMHKSAGVVFLNTPAKACLERNRKREDPVPETVISNLSAAIELPTRREGFREMLVVKEY